MRWHMKLTLWFVVLAGLGAVAFAMVTGSMHRDVEVEEDPYEAALRFDEDNNRASELGWRTGFIIRHKAGEADVRFWIRDRDGKPVRLASGDVKVLASRPAGDLDDVPCSLEDRGDGPVYGEIRAVCAPLAFGHWEFAVKIITDRGPVKFVERTYVKKRSD